MRTMSSEKLIVLLEVGAFQAAGKLLLKRSNLSSLKKKLIKDPSSWRCRNEPGEMVSCKQSTVQSSKERGNGNKANEKQHRSLLITMSLKGLVRHVRFIALVYNNLSLQRCREFLRQGENKSQCVRTSLNAVQLLSVISRFQHKTF